MGNQLSDNLTVINEFELNENEIDQSMMPTYKNLVWKSDANLNL